MILKEVKKKKSSGLKNLDRFVGPGRLGEPSAREDEEYPLFVGCGFERLLFYFIKKEVKIKLFSGGSDDQESVIRAVYWAFFECAGPG
jgi:hypothetical protein